MAKSMMHEKNMPYTFWGEAMNTSVYLLNRCPTKALDKKTSFEVFSGRKPSVKHLKVFGSKSPSEATLYTKIESNNKTINVSIYVDDVVYTGNDAAMIEEFKDEMMKIFEMTDLGLLHNFLGIGVIQEANNIFIHQKKYAETLLERFDLKGCKLVSTPLIVNEKLKKDDGSESVDASLYKSIVGSLLYLTVTRRDLMFSASLLFRFMQNPSKIHMGTAKRVLRYVQGTLDYGIKYEMGKSTILIGF
ncbi:uncharacterized mitochondrial protein AtMg00810-like [Malus domestica]|uniref:uncharacterized mitochondrial protein AtMg00810-like n=1 Tax=Malus domestica TaxID=3750 RepID=UPI003975ECEE